MVLFFMFTLRCGGSTAPYKKVFTNAGVDVGIASLTFICPHFRIHLPNTAHLSCSSANIGCNLYNIVSELSIYRLFLQKSAVLLDKKVNSRIMVYTRFEIQRRY